MNPGRRKFFGLLAAAAATPLMGRKGMKENFDEAADTQECFGNKRLSLTGSNVGIGTTPVGRLDIVVRKGTLRFG